MSLKVEEGQKIEYVLNTEEVSILTEMALIYWGEQNYKVALEIYQFLVGQYEKSFIKPVFHILDWGMSMGNYGMALEELGYFEKAIGVCRKRIQQTLFAGKGGSLHTSLMVEACILEAQKDVKCKKYFKQDLDLLRLYKMQTNYKLMAINEQISNFAQTYPTNLKASSNEALLFMRRYRFANCSCFSCCFKDAYPSSNVQ